MDGLKPSVTENNGGAAGAVSKSGRGDRRRRLEMSSADVRYFLPKPGAAAERPELGREITTEKEVLVEAFRTGQPFYTLTAWKAVSDTTDDVPKIVKEALKRP